MTSVIISKKVVIWYWTGSFVDLKFKMKKVTVQLKKLMLKEGVNRREENSYTPVYFPKSSRVQLWFKVCSSVFKVCLSVFECNLECEIVWFSVFECISCDFSLSKRQILLFGSLEYLRVAGNFSFYKFLLFLFRFEVIVYTYCLIIKFLQFILIYCFVEFKVAYIYRE